MGKIKYITSQYKCVAGYVVESTNETVWHLTKSGVTKKRYSSEREAAIAIDKLLISKGKDPVNVLKPKTEYERENRA